MGNDRMGPRYTSKFLQGIGLNCDGAYQIIMKHHTWYSSSFPCDGTPYLDFLRSGALYVSGRCKRGHQPIIVINIKKFIEQKKTV
jgi:hypothetical protein